MPDDNECSLFRIIAQVIPWFLIVGGWWKVNKQNNWRERRKELRSIINQLLDRLDEIERKAYEYHQCSKPTLAMGRDLKLALSRIGNIVDRQDLLPRGKRQSISTLRRAITLNNFDTDRFVSQLDDSELLAGISAAKDGLVDVLERNFQSVYRT